jgi:hypothetical protein
MADLLIRKESNAPRRDAAKKISTSIRRLPHGTDGQEPLSNKLGWQLNGGRAKLARKYDTDFDPMRSKSNHVAAALRLTVSSSGS